MDPSDGCLADVPTEQLVGLMDGRAGPLSSFYVY